MEEEILNRIAFAEMLYTMENILPQKQYDVLCRHYGVGNYQEAQSFVKIAKIYGVSSQWIGQLERKALRFLRKNEEMQQWNY